MKQIVDTDKLIHEPARVAIMALLNVADSADFVFLMNHTGLTQGNLSSHLSKLEAASYIVIEKTFVKKRPKTLIRMSSKGKDAFTQYLKTMKKFYQNLLIKQ
jgi:DNA-binding MarR family transcriptional regulator